MPRTAAARPTAPAAATPPEAAANTKREQVLVATPVGRIMYPYLLKKDEGRVNSSNKYSIDIRIPKDQWKEVSTNLRDTVLRVARNYFGKQNMTMKDFKHPFIDGDSKPTEAYKGFVVLRLRSEFKPTVIGPDRVEWNDDRIKAIKSGDFGRASVSVYGYPQGGVTLGLNVFQFAKEGQAEGGGRTASLEVLDDIEIGLDDIEGVEGAAAAGEVEEESSDDDLII